MGHGCRRAPDPEAGGLVTGIDGEDALHGQRRHRGTPKIFPELLKTLQMK